MRRRLLCVAAALGMLVTMAALAAEPAAGQSPIITPFRRVAAWIDVFDYAPRLQIAGAKPRVTPDSINDMASLGVRTLYVQVANPDGADLKQLTDRAELLALLERAHDDDIEVVPWFLPSLTTLSGDIALRSE